MPTSKVCRLPRLRSSARLPHGHPRIRWRVPLAFVVIAVLAAIIVQRVEHGLHERAANSQVEGHHDSK